MTPALRAAPVVLPLTISVMNPAIHTLTGIWRNEIDMSRIRYFNSSVRKAGPLEETWIERHRNSADCKCDFVTKKGFVTYVCTKCGCEI